MTHRTLISLATLLGCCCLVGACSVEGQVDDPGDGDDTTTLRLSARDDGDLESCDADGNCEGLSNPDRCDVLVIIIDNVSGRTCERCEDGAGQVIYDRCANTHVVCTVVTSPEPDCVVCSYDQGAVVYSTCVPDDRPDDECRTDAECDWGHTCESGQCVRTGECRWDSDCPRDSHCEGSSVCPPDVVCVWEGEPGNCVPNDPDPDNRCTSDADCDAGYACERRCDATACTDAGVCVPVVDPQRCRPEDCGRSLCPSITCPDGTSTGPCECVYDPTAEACHWQPINTCEPACDFDSPTADRDCAGRCRWDSDCPAGSHCEGSSVCPPDVVCVWAGEPGACVPDDANLCTADECGPAPMCPVYQCPDGSWAGCGPCERDRATGVCGWIIRECPPDPGCTSDADCRPGSICERTCDAAGCAGSCVPVPPPTCEPADCGRAPCPSLACPDGTTTSSCECLLDPAVGACRWTPIDTCGGACDFATDAVDPGCEGRCRWDSDCPAGSHCEGSSVCPPDVVCVWAGEPGYCVPDPPADCGLDACGPPPPCAALLCSDGGIVGCSCTRDPATNACGWIHDTCPATCGEVTCAEGYICCNASQNQCVPEQSDIACVVP